MDWVAWKNTMVEFAKKYRYVLLVVLVGLVLLALPEETEPVAQPESVQAEEKQNLQEDLATILSQIAGAGKVEVLLTQVTGEETIYQTDEDISTGESTSDVRSDTVLVTGADRSETGLVRQVNPPTYQGAIVLCQGADSAQVKLSIVEAVMSVTGLRSDCITVLKMK